MIKLLEKELLLKVRKEDVHLAIELIPECEREFKEIMARETADSTAGIEYQTKIRLLDNDFLTPE